VGWRRLVALAHDWLETVRYCIHYLYNNGQTVAISEFPAADPIRQDEWKTAKRTTIDRSITGTCQLKHSFWQAGKLSIHFSHLHRFPKFTSSPPPPTSSTPSIPPSIHSKPRLPRRRLRPALQVRVRVADRPGDSVESETRRFGRELHFGADVEEGEVPVDQMMGNTRRFVLKERKPIVSKRGR
jgi:hypothetical protein